MTEITEEMLAVLVRNLRSRMCMNMADGVECGEALPLGSPQYGCTCGEAAETITTLIAEVRKLREVLASAADIVARMAAHMASEEVFSENFPRTLAEFQKGEAELLEASRGVVPAGYTSALASAEDRAKAAEAEVARLREESREHHLRLLQRETEAWTDDYRVQESMNTRARLFGKDKP